MHLLNPPGDGCALDLLSAVTSIDARTVKDPLPSYWIRLCRSCSEPRRQDYPVVVEVLEPLFE
jgi:hypothetical protein